MMMATIPTATTYQVLHAVATEKVNEKTEATDEVLRKLMTMSLLPHNKIEAEFEQLKEDCTDDLKNKLEGLFTYYQSKWITDFTPAKFSLFGDIGSINDCSEIHQRVLLNKLQSDNPGFWKFIGFVSINFSKITKDYEKIINDDNKRPTYVSQINKSFDSIGNKDLPSKVQELWQQLTENIINPSEFLERGFNVMAGYYNDLFFNNYILPEELTIVSHDLYELRKNNYHYFKHYCVLKFLYNCLSFFFLANEYVPNIRNQIDDGDVIEERPFARRSRSALDEIERIVNELQPTDDDNEVVDGNYLYDSQCSRCKVKLVTTINFPCKHVEMCSGCASGRSHKLCSVCQKTIARTERIFLPTDTEGEGYCLNCEICAEQPVSIMWNACNQGLTCKRCAVRVVTAGNQSRITERTKLQCPHCNIETDGMIEFKLRRKNNN
ncbi:Protein of unknown function [Cotesia congregata]|uniref:RING-type domain-containing protein n=1 Tax=Cotesia congregata TaxID=51543 RepID=A0A8J2HD16_COTCN|nr:Protein of unknown function [Cotesia congregata]